MLPAAPQLRVQAAGEALVDLDLVRQRRALRVDHRPPQLVLHHPRRVDRLRASCLCSWVAEIPGVPVVIKYAAQNHRCSGVRVPCSTVPAVSDTW